MLNKYRRFAAFFLDMFIVCMLTICLTSVDFFNPRMYDVEEAQKEYQEVYQNITEVEDFETLEKSTQELTHKIYNFENTQLYIYIWYLIFYFGYFVIFSYFTQGKTLGKLFMKMRIVKEDGSDPSIINLFMRSLTNGSRLFMGANILVLLKIIFILLPFSIYSFALYFIAALVGSLIEVVNVVFFITRNDNRCLNDLISKTKVIDA